MTVQQFVSELLQALADFDHFDQVSLESEGPIANGRVLVRHQPHIFLRFYYNSRTGTLAFALIQQEQRIWGVDFDNRRGWHLHPLGNPTLHQPLEPLSVTEIVAMVGEIGAEL